MQNIKNCFLFEVFIELVVSDITTQMKFVQARAYFIPKLDGLLEFNSIVRQSKMV